VSIIIQSIQKSIQKQTEPKIFSRGKRLLDDVTDLSLDDNGGVYARVHGTEVYDVEIDLVGGDWEAHCTCPYFHQHQENCKHIAAVAILAEEELAEASKNETGTHTIKYDQGYEFEDNKDYESGELSIQLDTSSHQTSKKFEPSTSTQHPNSISNQTTNQQESPNPENLEYKDIVNFFDEGEYEATLNFGYQDYSLEIGKIISDFQFGLAVVAKDLPKMLKVIHQTLPFVKDRNSLKEALKVVISLETQFHILPGYLCVPFVTYYSNFFFAQKNSNNSQKNISIYNLQKLFQPKSVQPNQFTNSKNYLVFVFKWKSKGQQSINASPILQPHTSHQKFIKNINKSNYKSAYQIKSSSAKYLSELDFEIARIIDGESGGYYSWTNLNRDQLSDTNFTKSLKLLQHTNKLYTEKGDKIEVKNEKINFILQSKLNKKNELELTPVWQLGTQEYKFTQGILLGETTFWVFLKKEFSLHRLDTYLGLEQMKYLSQNLVLSSEEIPQFLTFCEENLADVVQLPHNLQIQEIQGSPTFGVYLENDSDSLKVSLQAEYHHNILPINIFDQTISKLNATVENGLPARIVRDLKNESQLGQDFKEILQNLGVEFEEKENEFYFDYENAAEFLTGFVDKIDDILGKKYQLEVFGKENLGKMNFKKADIKIQIDSGIDWLEVSGGMTFGEQFLNFAEISNMLSKGRFIQLKSGEVGVLPKKWLEQNREMLELAEQDGENLKISKFHLKLAEDFIQTSSPKKDQQKWQKTLDSLLDFKKIEKKKPKNIKAKLRNYQIAGYQWLHFLHSNRLGGILADDMGLGKTLQTLAFLSDLYLEQKVEKPTIIILPTSLIFNWQAEIAKFTPNLQCYNYTGNERDLEKFTQGFEDENGKKKAYHLLLTTYGTLLRDVEELKKIGWYYQILDESQQIKNPSSLTFKAVKLISSQFRLSLTGTPVENNLQDLWAQFSFVNPGMLGSINYFKENFALPIQKDGNLHQAQKLQKMAYPFILRRLKQDVAKDLEDKVENVVYVEMEESQQKMYDQVKSFYKASILDEIETKGLAQSKFKVLEGLLRLRQICCHPSLIEGSKVKKSAKFETMLEYLKEALNENHKVLIFSQFAKMLKIIETELQKQGIEYLYLDGQTKNRGKLVDKFQTDPESKVFLISLKAGGVGLNLTAADYVFMFDPWWNPAAEAQAIDRTHRIGQDKNVFSYKFIVKGSVEEKILKLQESKKNLVKQVIATEDGIAKSLNENDIKDLFG